MSKMKNVPKREKIVKAQVMRAMYKPTGDYYLEKMDAWTYKIHLYSSRDAAICIPPLYSKFDVERANSVNASTSIFIVRHKLKK